MKSKKLFLKLIFNKRKNKMSSKIKYISYQIKLIFSYNFRLKFNGHVMIL